MRKRFLLAALTGLPLLLTGALPAPAATAAPAVQVVLDGRTLNLSPAPTVVNGRTLVPMRALLEQMGAKLTWYQNTFSVDATKGDKYVRLKIDRRLACLDPDCGNAATLDVPATLVSTSTFVPVRFISQALGAKVSWDQARQAVVIETNKTPDYQFTSITIPTLTAGQVIDGAIDLRAAGATGASIQFMLLDPATGTGPLIAAGADPNGTYTFWPDPTIKGKRLIVAAVKDSSGAVRYSDPVSVVLAPKPAVTVAGIATGATITDPIQLWNTANFVSSYSKIQVLDAMGNAEEIGTVGTGDKLTWYPQIAHNGDRWISAVAYDRYGNPYESQRLPVKVQSGYRQGVSEVWDGAVLTGPVTLRPTANYPIDGVKYTLNGQVVGWGYSYTLNITKEWNGPHTLQVDVLDKSGTWRSIGPIKFTAKVTPSLWLSGVGPDEVVTGAITLKASSNVTVSGIRYYVTTPSGTTSVLGDGASHTWTPSNSGTYTVFATAKDAAGNTLTTEKVSFRSFKGTTYGPVPLTTKTDFKEMAMRFAVPAYRETGMSAALQVAQSLLETGWGQSVPVDKYTGQLSYNLFGIKGTGPAGSIISNTWEEYNGYSFRIDANFRAYHSVNESWNDHAALLLTKSWYAPFRAVMTDPVLGAWGLRRSGYATDSQYPIKLINIMKQNDLFKLDKVEL